MISHASAQSLVSARLDGPLSSAEAQTLGAHLASCPACRRFATQSDSLARDLLALPHLPPSPYVTRHVLERLGDGPSIWGRLRGGLEFTSSPLLTVASTCVLIVAVAFTILLAINPPGQGEPTDATQMVALQPMTETPAASLPTERATPSPTPRVINPSPTVGPDRNAPLLDGPTATIPATRAQPTSTPRTSVIVDATATATAIAPPEPTAIPTIEIAPTPPSVPPPTLAPDPPAAPTPRVETVIIGSEASGVVAASSGNQEGSPPIMPVSDAAAAVDSTESIMIVDDPNGGTDPVEPAPVATEPALAVIEATDPGQFDPSAATTAQDRNGTTSQATPLAGVEAIADETGGDATAADVDLGEMIQATVAANLAEAGIDTSDRVGDNGNGNGNGGDGRGGNDSGGSDTRSRNNDEERQDAAKRDAEPTPDAERRSRRTAEFTENAALMVVDPNLSANIRSTVAARIAGIAPDPLGVAAPAPELAGDFALGSAVTIVPPVRSQDAALEEIRPRIAPVAGGGAESAAGTIAGRLSAGSGNVAPDSAETMRSLGSLPPGIDIAAAAVTTNGALALSNGAGVTIFESGGAPVATIAGASMPMWSPLGGVLMVVVPDQSGNPSVALWDRAAGELFVPAGSESDRPHRDLPAGWAGPVAYFQRTYLDSSDVVELTSVSAVSGAPAEVVWSGSGGLFGDGVEAAQISPAGDRLAFLQAGKLYVAQLGDLERTAAVIGSSGSFGWSPAGDLLAVSNGSSITVYDLVGTSREVFVDADGRVLGAPVWREDGLYVARGGDLPNLVLISPAAL